MISRCRGFSLLEVLVAFAILGIAIGVLLQIFATGLRSVALSEEYTYAALWAESRLAEIGVTEVLEEGEAAGELSNGYRWRSVVAPYEPPSEETEQEDDEDAIPFVDESVIPYEITLEVVWGEGGKERSVRLTTLRLQRSL